MDPNRSEVSWASNRTYKYEYKATKTENTTNENNGLCFLVIAKWAYKVIIIVTAVLEMIYAVKKSVNSEIDINNR